ncbi:PREDICTED: 28S ribosomal protein S15, mitochondrial-like, partial [Rhagoletis zephyria]|uniref:28S ribosomal protein S15, mitochondrial-like n=1 Tax=Rhagoletis zephyria TaxID=28612 RepID=UPI0008118514
DQVVEFQRRKIVSLIQRHPLDDNSPEVKIAQYTVRIRNNLHRFTKIDKYDAPRKIVQETLKNRRAKLLKDLFYQDRDRYDYVIKLLGITHEVPKMGVKYLKPTRKGELRRLTAEYCDRLKEERLTEYHEELKRKQETLTEEEEKIKQLIAQESKYLGTQNPPTEK